MTDAMPPSPPPPPPYPVAPQGWGPPGKVRNPWGVIGLSIITLGIYSLYWQYQVFREMKDHTHEGVGGLIGLLLALLGWVNPFLMPYEIGNIFAKSGQPKPVTGLTGFWLSLPLVGWLIWVVKVQGALNTRWEQAPA